MRIALIDPFAGVAGDMFVGALLDAGASIDRVQKPLELLQVHDVPGEVLHEHFHRPLADRLDVGALDRIVLTHPASANTSVTNSPRSP